MAQATTMDISQGHLILLRHAEAISNVIGPTEGLNPETMTLSELTALAGGLQHGDNVATHIRHGVYLPDGLTQSGLQQIQEFVDHVTDGGNCKIDNVYMIASSPLTRACQTATGISPACDLIGSRYLPEQQKEGNIYCHPGVIEATTWPQDFPALRDDKGFAWYFNVKGGNEADAGKILCEKKVDLSRTVWPASEDHKWLTVDDRTAALQASPDREEITEMARRCRVWLRACMMAIMEEHETEKREGSPRILLALHGGIRHFLTKKWYCSFTKGDSGRWVWAGSSALKNMELNVYTFNSLTDEEADLEELDWSVDYVGDFGKYYRHMASDSSLVYKASDGTIIDQEAEHWNFIERVAGEVQATAEKKQLRAVIVPFLIWKGASNFLSE
ncbi:hypothetical protein S40285_09440 [Stachybotrys chlorohalonatus IBT 40285]|uniref:Uncharacterized protein n=1 Tax=Stachybotrys chlorohalonatus (strain IBT 40285) TaxID=1283841 RepID=A0A084QTF0_STAC4|nr:hypothetical protein S40285_09440 [Stachybotrys chlorohalonata IBT 40285]